jgi:hypothetical protein
MFLALMFLEITTPKVAITTAPIAVIRQTLERRFRVYFAHVGNKLPSCQSVIVMPLGAESITEFFESIGAEFVASGVGTRKSEHGFLFSYVVVAAQMLCKMVLPLECAPSLILLAVRAWEAWMIMVHCFPVPTKDVNCAICHGASVVWARKGKMARTQNMFFKFNIRVERDPTFLTGTVSHEKMENPRIGTAVVFQCPGSLA